MPRGSIGLVPIDTDGRWLGGRYYLQHLVASVARLPETERIPLRDVRWNSAAGDDPFAEVREHIETAVLKLPASAASRALRVFRNGFTRAKDAGDVFRRAGIGVVFPSLPCYRPGIPFLFWAADFQHRLRPEFYTQDGIRRADAELQANLDSADLVAVSSELALAQFDEFFPDRRGSARVLHFCSVPGREWWVEDPELAARLQGLPERFLLLSNQFTHHKNHEVVFEAVRLLKARGRTVVLVCTGSTFGYRGPEYFERLMEFRKRHELESEIRILGMLPRSRQVALMRQAVGLLQPSHFEGWATAVEDAKTLGKALLVSDIAIHREQLGPAGHYLPPNDPEAWADAMAVLLDSGTGGADAANEKSALVSLEKRAQQVGRTFISIATEAMTGRKGVA